MEESIMKLTMLAAAMAAAQAITLSRDMFVSTEVPSFCGLSALEDTVPNRKGTVRFATFTASLNRFNAGDQTIDLFALGNSRVSVVAESNQRARPDVLLINGFHYDAAGEAAALLRQNNLSLSQHDAMSIH
ncbi:MAG: hypothetical protein KJO91_07865 [Gammaproteobacteria bacterium]|nr:hypothetical protein [Gammaproteobacteria bacterium]